MLLRCAIQLSICGQHGAEVTPTPRLVEALRGHCTVDVHYIYLRNGRVHHDGCSSRPKVAPPICGAASFEG